MNRIKNYNVVTDLMLITKETL